MISWFRINITNLKVYLSITYLTQYAMSSFKMWHSAYSVLFDPRNKTLTKLATSTVMKRSKGPRKVLYSYSRRKWNVTNMK